MRKTFTAWFLTAGVGVAALMMLGGKKHATPAPVQTVVWASPPVKTVPDFSTDPLPVKNVDEDFASPRRPQRTEVQLAQVQPTDTVAAQIEAPIETQRSQDARLLLQQEAESQQQQQELDKQIDEDMRAEQKMQSEPRIQEPPEQPLLPPPPQEEPIPAPPTTPQ